MSEKKINYDLHLSDELAADIDNFFAMGEAYSKQYPWEGLEDYLERQKESSLKIVGYGSLLNKKSAALTFTAGKITPVIAFGVNRIFNYVIPEDNPRYGVWTNPLERAALNVEVKNNAGDFINGAQIEVPLHDLENLRKREIAYDLIQVPCIFWDSPDNSVFYSFILHCPYPEYEGVEKTNNNLKPHKDYYRVCREGAQSFGEKFLQCWKSTTFLGDGITPADKWEIEAGI